MPALQGRGTGLRRDRADLHFCFDTGVGELIGRLCLLDGLGIKMVTDFLPPGTQSRPGGPRPRGHPCRCRSLSGLVAVFGVPALSRRDRLRWQRCSAEPKHGRESRSHANTADRDRIGGGYALGRSSCAGAVAKWPVDGCDSTMSRSYDS